MSEPTHDTFFDALRTSRPAPDPQGDVALAQRIAARLRALEGADAAPAGVATPAGTQRGRHGLRPRRAAVIGVAASIFAVGIATGVLVGAGARATTPSFGGHVRLAVELLAKHVRSALSTSSTSLLEATSMTLTSPNGSRAAAAEGWFYGDQSRTELFDAQGDPVIDVATTYGSGTRTSTVVIYATRRWSTVTRAIPGEQELFDVSSLIRAGLADGTIQEVGTAPLNGVPATEIEVHSSDLVPNEVVAMPHKLLDLPFLFRPAESLDGMNVVEIWIDPTSDLPMQEMVTFPGGGSSTTTFAWESPTSAALAELTVTPPSGFTEVPSGVAFATR